MEIQSNILSAFLTSKELSKEQFLKLSSFITKYYGFKLPEIKRTTLQCRLLKRLRALEMDDFDEYIAYLFSKEGQSNELMYMMDEVSTNKTDFFREIDHFNLLAETILFELTASMRIPETIKIWSAGCSSGEEAYTIAFTLEEFRENNKTFDYKIYGTDISKRVVKEAVEAIYSEEKVAIVPENIKRKYMLRSRDRDNPSVRIKPNLREKTLFNRQNLMDTSYNVPDNLDIIFCRNVLIYFDSVTQEKVLRKLLGKLKKDGYLFLGHSESIANMDLPLVRLKPTVFKKK